MDSEMEGIEETDVSNDVLYTVGDFLDALHPDIGAWFEAQVQRITILSSSLSSSRQSSHFTRFTSTATATTRILHSRNPSSSHESDGYVNTLTPSVSSSSPSVSNILLSSPSSVSFDEGRRSSPTPEQGLSSKSQNEENTRRKGDEKWIRDLHFHPRVSDPSFVSESKKPNEENNEMNLQESDEGQLLQHHLPRRNEKQENEQEHRHDIKCEKVVGKMTRILDEMKGLEDQRILEGFKTRYYIKFLKESLSSEVLVRSHHQVRPISTRIVAFSQVSVGSLVLVNCNLDQDKARGYWYDCLITKKDGKRKRLYGTIFTTEKENESLHQEGLPCIGSQVGLCPSRTSPPTITTSDRQDDQTITSQKESGHQLGEDEGKVASFLKQRRTCIQDQRIWFIREVYLIEKNVARLKTGTTTKASSQNEIMSIKHRPPDKLQPILRPTPYDCDFCHDSPSLPCRECCCVVCGEKNDPDKQIICDECHRFHHLWCIRPVPLKELPEESEQWFCPDCRNNDAELIKLKESLHLFGSKEKRVTSVPRNERQAKKQKKDNNNESRMTKSCRDEQERKKTQMSGRNRIETSEEKRKHTTHELMTTSHSLSCIEKLGHLVDQTQTPLSEASGIKQQDNHPTQRDQNPESFEFNDEEKKKESRSQIVRYGASCIGRRFTASETGMQWGIQSVLQSNIPSTTFFGPIPGIEVGSTWRFRFQVSEAGIHSPLVAGVAGKESVGASSIVFSCLDSDDVDLGDTIYFTGSGGFDLGKKTSRTAIGKVQVKDQSLTRGNKALAMSCAVPFNTDGGFSGSDWKLGKPIRVLRSGNSRGCHKRSRFLPKIGIRYDGIYKVVKYWSEKRGRKSLDNDVSKNNDSEGIIVWRFLLKRDDPTPSPWTKEGKKRIRRLQLHHLIQPKMMTSEIMNTSSTVTSIISNHHSCNGIETFVEHHSRLKCVICLEFIVDDSVTTLCQHTFCRDCLRKCFNSNGNQCPICRRILPKILPK